MGYGNIKEVLVYSQRPADSLVEFCENENISIVWIEEEVFKIHDSINNMDKDFNPLELY